MKKVLLILFALILLGAICNACTPDSETASTASTTTTKTVTSTPNPTIKPTVTPETEPTVTPIEEQTDIAEVTYTETESVAFNAIDLSDIPDYSGEAYVVINDNVPYFTEEDLTDESYESYSTLDALGRCGVAVACVGQDLMPTEERGEIGQVKPTGWQTVTYDCVDGRYLYNRCHLIGYQLSGENANTQNLITGTRYMNVDGMLPFENMVADYVQETDNHVLYRVTPIFDGDNLLASGVLMEAESVEDQGESILFCVYCYNVQPGVVIDYATGDNYAAEATIADSVAEQTEVIVEPTVTPEPVDYSEYTYVLNTSSKKVHLPSCSSVSTMNEENKQGSNASVDELIDEGYTPCGNCQPFVIESEENTSSATTTTTSANSQTVYVSSTGKIHSKSNCSGMKNYTKMTYSEAIAAGYTPCKKCY